MKLLPYPTAHHPSGSDPLQGTGAAGAAEHEIRHIRGNDITIIFQEPMTSLNPLHTIEKQISEIIVLHGGLTAAPARARVDRAAHAGRHSRSGRRGSRAIRISSPAASASA